jgi:hypothetical protein
MKRGKSISVSHCNCAFKTALFFLVAVLVSFCGERSSDTIKSKETKGPSIEYLINNGRPAIKINLYNSIFRN